MQIIEKINNEIKSLPTLPTIFDSISNILKDPLVSPEKLAKIIATDQASVIKVLKVANSPFYGFRGKIDTITKALFYLGFKEVQNLVFALAVMNLFSKNKIIKGFHPKDFWAHSIAVGIISRNIGDLTGEKNLENYFLAGVLHDIGKLLFMEYALSDYEKVYNLAESKSISIKKAEFEVLGFDHTSVGKLLAEKWKLPTIFIDTIYYHHIGFVGSNPDNIVGAVHIADIVARFLEYGNPGDKCFPKPNPKVWEYINIPPGYFTATWKRFEEDFLNTVSSILED